MSDGLDPGLDATCRAFRIDWLAAGGTPPGETAGHANACPACAAFTRSELASDVAEAKRGLEHLAALPIESGLPGDFETVFRQPAADTPLHAELARALSPVAAPRALDLRVAGATGLALGRRIKPPLWSAALAASLIGALTIVMMTGTSRPAPALRFVISDVDAPLEINLDPAAACIHVATGGFREQPGTGKKR